MADPITDAQLKDFAAGLRDDLTETILTDEDYLERLAAIWAEEDYEIDVREPVLRAVKASRFATDALAMAAAAAVRIARGFSSYASGRSERT